MQEIVSEGKHWTTSQVWLVEGVWERASTSFAQHSREGAWNVLQRRKLHNARKTMPHGACRVVTVKEGTLSYLSIASRKLLWEQEWFCSL